MLLQVGFTSPQPITRGVSFSQRSCDEQRFAAGTCVVESHREVAFGADRSSRLAWLLLALSSVARWSHAAVREEFESPEPTWRLARYDCGLEITRHQRTFDEAHSGQGCEWLRIQAGHGTYVHLVHAVSPSRVIAELIPQVWIKSDRKGLQVYARVVLPRAIGKDGQPLTALLPGELYHDVGSWQRLRVNEIRLQLDRQVRILRAPGTGREMSVDVDPGEAYVDALVLNAYGGPGVTNVWIDDLEMDGYAFTTLTAQTARQESSGEMPGPRKQGFEVPSARTSTERVCLQGSILVVNGRPFFARTIEHQGESLEWLSSLGFNVIELRGPPTASQLAEAERFGVWLLAPPPVSREPAGVATSLDRVLAWNLGDLLSESDVAASRPWSSQLRSDPQTSTRPIVGCVSAPSAAAGEVADILVLHRPVVGTSFPLSTYWSWLRQSAERLRRNAPFWVAIQTELPSALQDQIAAMSSGSRPLIPVELFQMERMAADAIAAGARGLCFRSRSRLDATDDATRLRATTVHLINQEMSLIEAWAAGGSYVEELEVADVQLRARILETQRARLLVIARHGAQEQLVSSPHRGAVSPLVVHGTPITDQAYRLGPVQLEPLQGQRGNGIRVPLEDAGAVAFVLLTQDPLAVNYARRGLMKAGREIAQLYHQSALLTFSQTQGVDRELNSLGQASPQAGPLLGQASARLQQAERLLQTADDENAVTATTDALQSLCQVRRVHWERAARPFPSPLASPLIAAFPTLPLHWRLVARMGAARWQTNLLAGGDFESLEHMEGNGWQQSRAREPGIETAVELSLIAPRSGRSSLRLQVWSSVHNTIGDGGWPISITSAAVPVQPGQLIRIGGWVKVAETIRGSLDGLMIFDSCGGLDLAQRIEETEGWQEFALYRAATRSGELTVTFALTGLGEVWLDDVEISRLE